MSTGTGERTVTTPAAMLGVVAGLVEAADRGHSPEWERGLATLATFEARAWLLADDVARHSYFGHLSAVGWDHRVWTAANLDEPSGFVAAVNSWHPSGRVRELAVRALAGHRSPVATSALAVRLLDHVVHVRAEAQHAVADRLSLETGRGVLGVLVAASDHHRAPQAIALVSSALDDAALLDDVLLQLLGATDRRLRRWAHLEAEPRGLTSDEHLLSAAERDPDQYLRAWAADRLGTRTTPAELRRLLRARSAEARLVALTRVSDDDLDDDTLRRMMSDRSSRVRETARWRVRRRAADAITWCRSSLDIGTLTPRQEIGSLEGLVAFGDAGDAELAARSLLAALPSVRAAAVAAIAALAGDASVPVLRPLLLDRSSRVSAAAARALQRVGAGPEHAEDAWASPNPASRRAAWRLSRAFGAWARVEADLRSVPDPDPALAASAAQDLRSWVHGEAGVNAGRVPPGRRQRLLDLVERCDLDDHTRRLLLLHLR